MHHIIIVSMRNIFLAVLVTYMHAQSKVLYHVLQRTLSTSFEEVIHHLKSIIMVRNIFHKW